MGEEITTIDFDVGGDWDDDDFDPTRPRLENATKTGHPFSVSWSREVRAVLSGLDSERLKDADGPWVTESPFDLTDVRELRAAIIPDSTGGGGLSSTGQYRDGMSTMSESGTDHLSAGLGISVGYPFLKASVSGKYDKKVTEDKNGIKASRNSSCRVGRVLFDRTPRLSEEAIILLQTKNGQDKFRKRYGDYYVSGFVLGADAGACMSAYTASKETSVTKEITVTVKTLFWSASETYRESEYSYSTEAAFSMSAYSTLVEDGDSSGLSPVVSINSTSTYQMETLVHTTAVYLEKVRELQSQVKKIMCEVGLEDGARLPVADCGRLCKSGLVAELLLQPYARLNEYLMWA